MIECYAALTSGSGIVKTVWRLVQLSRHAKDLVVLIDSCQCSLIINSSKLPNMHRRDGQSAEVHLVIAIDSSDSSKAASTCLLHPLRH